MRVGQLVGAGAFLVLSLSGCQLLFSDPGDGDQAAAGSAGVGGTGGNVGGTGGNAGGSGGGSGAIGGSGGGSGAIGGSGGGSGAIGGSGGAGNPADCSHATPASYQTVGKTGHRFQIGFTEVTRCQYKKWLDFGPNPGNLQLPEGCESKNSAQSFTPSCQDNGCTWPPSKGEENLPVTGVDFCDAWAFCRGVGKRLCGKIDSGEIVNGPSFGDPNIDEWHAVCSNGGKEAFPYGSTYDKAACVDASNSGNQPGVAGYLDSCRRITGFFANVKDLSGNVWEWEYACSTNAAGILERCHVRGGSFNNATSNELSCSFDYSQLILHRDSTIGFRCCADLK